MKMLLKTIVGLAIVLGMAMSASAQKVGGYKPISRSDAKVQAAAEFAVDAQAERKSIKAELLSVEKAESQVVAGTNYRLCLKVTLSGADDEADIITTVRVIVYRDLKGKYSLTSWMEEDCSADDDGS
jgi:BioD-like phosphotransacetylase family protein